MKLGIADGIVSEPLGGAHHDWTEVSENMKSKIVKDLIEYRREKPADIQEERYQKFRNMGQYIEA